MSKRCFFPILGTPKTGGGGMLLSDPDSVQKAEWRIFGVFRGLASEGRRLGASRSGSWGKPLVGSRRSRIYQFHWNSPNVLFWLNSFNPWFDPITLYIPFNFIGTCHFSSFFFDPPHWNWIVMRVGPRRSSADSVGVSRILDVMTASYIHI